MRVDPKTLQGNLPLKHNPLCFDGRPFPTDIDLVLAIRRRLEAGYPDAAVALVSQFRERLLYHPESQEQAKAHGGKGSTGFF